jgi:hypothetical protein
MSGALQTLGVYVPRPEVVADQTNPKGFGEAQWVVDFHTELLKQSNVAVSDARPAAWFEAGKMANQEPLRVRLHQWLEKQFAQAEAAGNAELVIKDPRLGWFLGLWRSASLRCEVSPAYVTMLRPVTEVVGSKQRYYSTRFGEIDRTAAWINMMLHTERATRGSARAFVRYDDLLRDWTIPLFDIGQRFDLYAVKHASANHIRAVHEFIDPGLRRVQLTWDDIDVPARLRDLAEESWQALNKLAGEDGDRPDAHAALDEVRAAYADYYEEAEAVASSTALAARREGQAAARRASGGDARGPVPQGLRALVPAPARRGIRRALGRER